tara:strand:+ start:1753 stop:1944 length:192 start_codon:yes stop_codon:yes gene_type:complete
MFIEVRKSILKAIIVKILIFLSDCENIQKDKCYGKKTVFKIKKVVNEIALAKARIESDDTYSA